MEKENYAFLKTGFNNVQESEDETKKNIISMILLYAEGAMTTAGKYVVHGNRTEITPEDLKRAMMLEMFFFKKRDNALENALKIKEELFNEDSDVADNVVETNEVNEAAEAAELVNLEEFKLSSCSCALCKCMNNVYERWGKWEPKTKYDMILQEHIENMN